MSDHLPECQYGLDYPCICDRLRACEARVMLRNSEYHYSRECEKAGYWKGLTAARDAVAGGLTFCWYHDEQDNCVEAIEVTDALAAIDALRGDA